jgi:7-keto-8-aminopelargonate synthetase-like enzyme
LIQEEPYLRNMLWKNASCVEEGLKKIGLYKRVESQNSQLATHNSLTPKGPIFPIIVGESRKALEISNQLYEENIFVPAIRPPTVPEDTSRLRLTVMTTHTPEHINKLLDALSDLKKG